MSATVSIADVLAERIVTICNHHRGLPLTEKREMFRQQLERAEIRLDLLDEPERLLHTLAQAAVRAFKAVPELPFQDVVRIVLWHSHGGVHGAKLARSPTFNKILSIYRP